MRLPAAAWELLSAVRGRHRFRRSIRTVVGVGLLAVILGAGATVAVDLWPGLCQTLETRLESRTGAQVQIASVSLGWRDLEPRLVLHGLEVVFPGARAPVHARTVRVGANYRALLHGELRPARIAIAGLELHFGVDAQGQVHTPQFALESSGSGDAARRFLSQLKRLHLQHCVVLVGAKRFKVDGTLERLGAAASAGDTGYDLNMRVVPPSRLAASAQLRAEIHGDPLAASGIRSLNVHWQAALHGLRSLAWLDQRLGGDRSLRFESASVHLAGDISNGHLHAASGRFAAPEISVEEGNRRLASLHNVVAKGTWKRTANGWQLILTRLSAMGGGQTRSGISAHARVEYGAAGWSLSAAATQLPLAVAVPWFKLSPRGSAVLEKLPGLGGSFDKLRLEIEHPADAPEQALLRYRVSAQLHDVGWQPAGKVPGIRGLSGSFSVDNEGGQMQLASAPTVQLPRVLFDPVTLKRLDATIHWHRLEDGAWRIQVSPLQVATLGAEAQGRAQLTLPAAKDASGPALKLDLDLHAADAARLKPLMPRVWNKGLRDWLEQALVHATVAGGHLVIDGPLKTFPYAGSAGSAHTGAGAGHWALDLQVADADLNFDAQWPALRDMAGQLHFTGYRMDVDVSKAKLGQIQIQKINAQLPDFRSGDLSITADAGADMADWYAFLQDSPVHERLAALTGRSTARGRASVHLRLRIPPRDVADTDVAGTVQFHDVEYKDKPLNIAVDDIGGSLSFDAAGLTGLHLTGKAGAVPVQAALQTLAGHPGLAIRFQVDPSRDALAARYVPDWLRVRLPGAAWWQLDLPLQGSRNWSLHSRLQGTAVDLPVPLAKPAQADMPVVVTPVEQPVAARGLRIDGGNRFGVRLRYGQGADTIAGVGLRLGRGAPVDASGDGLRIGGAPAKLDVGGVLSLLAGLSGQQQADKNGAGTALALAFLGGHLAIGDLYWHSLHLADVAVQIEPDDEGLGIAIRGTGAKGDVFWNRASSAIKARFAKLQFAALAAPEATPRQTGPAGGATRQKPPLDPTQLPTLDLQCQALQVGDYALGKLVLKTSRTPGGQKIDVTKLSGASVGIGLTGDWTRANGLSSARLGFALNAQKLGDALNAFGFERSVTAKHARFRGSVRIPPAASGLDLTMVEGKVSVELKDGELEAVNPGAGRVLGLLNIYALPRRLLRKFSDVADKGLVYDDLTADFKLGDGQAWTQNAHIAGPSLNLDISGRIGLQAHDLDETVRVYPKIASGVTVGAVLLGGPIAGGIALIAQQLFGKALSHLTELSYRIVGSWSNPKVMKISREQAETNAAAAAVPAAASSSASSPSPRSMTAPLPDTTR